MGTSAARVALLLDDIDSDPQLRARLNEGNTSEAAGFRQELRQLHRKLTDDGDGCDPADVVTRLTDLRTQCHRLLDGDCEPMDEALRIARQWKGSPRG